jgi:hypothetical protein
MALLTRAWFMAYAVAAAENGDSSSRKEKAEMLEEYGESLKNEPDGVEEEPRVLKEEQANQVILKILFNRRIMAPSSDLRTIL